MEVDFEKKGFADLSPNTVLPLRHCSKIEKRDANGKPPRRDDVLRVKDGFTEISFRRYRSSSCKNVPSRATSLKGDVQLKRGSVYQSSTEVRRMKKIDPNEGRRKIELSRASESAYSFRIVDSLCSSDEESKEKKSPVVSGNSKLNPVQVRNSCEEPCSSSSFIEFCPDLGREKISIREVRNDPTMSPKFRCEQVVGPANDGNSLTEQDTALTFGKSLSAKVEIHNSPSHSESDFSSAASSQSRFGPFRKMFDPFMKSKSLRNSLSNMPEAVDLKSAGTANMRSSQTFRKSLLNDFSHTAQKSSSDSHVSKRDHQHSAVSCSPVHLHGYLKLENKNGVPHFEFSINCPEEVFVAKAWKASNPFNWVYTFHSIGSRKKSNPGGLSSGDGGKEPLIVAQMQVSCYLCSELRDGSHFDNSMMTEFLMYDTAHARHSFSSQASPDISKPFACGFIDGSDAAKLKLQPKYSFESNNNIDSSIPCPLPSAVLHPHLETAAIAIQLPFAKRESLKYKRGPKVDDKSQVNLLKFPMVEQRRKGFPDSVSQDRLRVIIPTGNHSLPSDESQACGPSSLLDRWRSGGGCDCGGWDMACPLMVFGNPRIQCAEDQPLIHSQHPLELFIEGTKDNVPALSMTAVKDGHYAIDFHAQLSALQAFSICVAVLHGTVASSVTGDDRNKLQLPHCNSLKVLIEEEVKLLIEAVTDEEVKKKKRKKATAAASKIKEKVQQSYVVNPPFSPISRV